MISSRLLEDRQPSSGAFGRQKRDHDSGSGSVVGAFDSYPRRCYLDEGPH
jgi:hypothetical protein